MPKPTPGSTYVVVKGDTLWDIATSAFGNPWRYVEIFEANRSTLRSPDDPHWIYPGEVLIIPPGPNLLDVTADDTEILPDADPNAFQFILDGKQYPAVGSSIKRIFNAGSDVWSGTFFWDPDIERDRDTFRPYSFHEAKAYVGGELMVSGRIYRWDDSVTPDKTSMSLQGYSRTKDLIDSAVDPPYQRNGVELVDIVKKYCEPRRINVIDSVGSLGAFKKITADPNDRIMDFLIELAKQKGVILTSTPKGDLHITKAATQIDNLGTLGDGMPLVTRMSASYDGSQRFRTFRMEGKRRGRRKIRDEVIDNSVSLIRTKAISADDAKDSAGLRKAGEWERSKSLSDSMQVSVDVSGWRSPAGPTWRENRHVTVVSPKLFLSDGFTFLIKSVDFKSDTSGRSTTLELVPPSAFSGEELEQPWD